jgi:hypothetical protein
MHAWLEPARWAGPLLACRRYPNLPQVAVSPAKMRSRYAGSSIPTFRARLNCLLLSISRQGLAIMAYGRSPAEGSNRIGSRKLWLRRSRCSEVVAHDRFGHQAPSAASKKQGVLCSKTRQSPRLIVENTDILAFGSMPMFAVDSGRSLCARRSDRAPSIGICLPARLAKRRPSLLSAPLQRRRPAQFE